MISGRPSSGPILVSKRTTVVNRQSKDHSLPASQKTSTTTRQPESYPLSTSKKTSITSRSPAHDLRRCVTDSYVSHRADYPLPTSRRTSTTSFHDAKPHPDAATHPQPASTISTRHPANHPLPASTAPSRRHRDGGRSDTHSAASTLKPGPPPSEVLLDVSDAESLEPDDSISCVGERKKGRRRHKRERKEGSVGGVRRKVRSEAMVGKGRKEEKKRGVRSLLGL